MISRFARGTLPARPIFQSPLTLALAAVLAFGVATVAQSLYLPTGGPDGIALLPSPPAPHSSEEAAELACVRSVFNARTPAEEAHATNSSTLSFTLFAAPIGSVFDLKKLPKTKFLLEEVKREIGTNIDTPKEFFKRLRPYVLDHQLSLGQPEPSASY